MFRHCSVLLLFAAASMTATASDWTHWRGPWQTGVSPDKNLPDKVDGNVIWRQPYGGRSTPIVKIGRAHV